MRGVYCDGSSTRLRRDLLDRVKEDEVAVIAVGVEWASDQARRLLAGGAPGIHFYTLNRSPATRAILAALRSWLPAVAPA